MTYERLRRRALTTGLAVALMAGQAGQALGQAQSTGVDIDGKILVTIYVTMREPDGYARPMSRVRLALAKEGASRLELATDDAGVLRTLLPPGEYRVSTMEPVVYRGRAFSWIVPLSVRVGMRILELEEQNATTVETAAGGAVDRSRSSSSGRMPLGRRNPATALIYSMLLPGTGQMYNRESGKGAAMLLGAAGLIAGGAVASSDDNSTPLVVGLTGAAVISIWSMFDAVAGAERYNVEHGLVASGVTPRVERSPEGRWQVGVQLAF